MYDSSLYRELGSVVELLSNSQYHRDFELKRYLRIEIAPAFRHKQVKVFYCDDKPIALVTWARLSSEVLDDLVCSQRSLCESDWKCGDLAFVNDLVVKGQHLHSVVSSIKHNLFWADGIVYAFRRSADGSVRKLCRFKNVLHGKAN